MITDSGLMRLNETGYFLTSYGAPSHCFSTECSSFVARAVNQKYPISTYRSNSMLSARLALERSCMKLNTRSGNSTWSGLPRCYSSETNGGNAGKDIEENNENRISNGDAQARPLDEPRSNGEASI